MLPRIPESPRITWLVGIIFLLGAILYTTIGFKRFFAHPEGPIDYRQRWVEQQYFYGGINPYDVSHHALNHEDLVISSRALSSLDESLGSPPTLGYPPWSHAIQIPLIPPGTTFPISRLVFAAVNLAALILSAFLLWRLSKQCGLKNAESLVTVSACLSLASITATLGNGQYGIIVNAMILLTIDQLNRHRFLGTAAAFSIALLKPTNSGPFFFLLARNNSLRTIIICPAIIALFSLFFWWVTGVNPLRAFLQMLTYTTSSMGAPTPWNQTPLSWAIALGVPPLPATLAFGISGLVLSLVVGFRFRHMPWLIQAAAFGVIARLWTKHFSYDNVLIVFLLFGLSVLFFRRPSFLHLAWTSAVGLTLWLPTSLFNNPPATLTQIIIWCAATIFLLRKNEILKPNPSTIWKRHPYSS